MKSFLTASLKAGIIVGILDGMAACGNAYLMRGVAPAGVFRYVASGYFGQAAFSGNNYMIAYGVGFHFFIAILWTMLYFFLCRKWSFLSRNKISSGLGYGLLVWLIMNAVVLPLSNIVPPDYKLIPTLIMIGIHLFIIGLSISLLSARLKINR
jgi:hypothetical protein